MFEVKIRSIGSSLGVILPKEALAKLRAGKDDKLFLTEAPDGSLRITAYDPDFAAQMEIAEKGMSAYRNTLKKLSE